MSTSDRTLSELAKHLDANGMVVVPHKDYLEIRLPVFASVRVRIVDGRLSCEARFGFIPRDRASWVTLIGLAVVTASAFLELGITPISMLLGFVSVSSTASTAIRYQLTESCIAQVRTAFMLLTSGHVSAVAPPESRRAIAEPGSGPEAGGIPSSLTVTLPVSTT